MVLHNAPCFSHNSMSVYDFRENLALPYGWRGVWLVQRVEALGVNE